MGVEKGLKLLIETIVPVLARECPVPYSGHTVAQCLIPEVGLWYELESSGVVEDELKVVTEMPMKWATIELRWIPMERTGAVSLIAIISSSHTHTSRYSTVPFLKHSGSLL